MNYSIIMKKFSLLIVIVFASYLNAQDYVDTTFTITTETDVIYGSAENFAGVQKTLEMDISYPTNDVVPDCGRPLALIVHGGAWAVGSKEDATIIRMREDFAKRGYVTAAINYRLGYFYTDLDKNCNIAGWNCLNLSDSSEWIRAWYRGVQDAKGALRYLIENQSTYEIDPSNVFVFGESAGAYISIGVAYLDVESEKPESCFELNSVNPPHQNLYSDCIQGSSFDMPIGNMNLSRSDLGSVNGTLNPISQPYIIKGVGSFYGGLFSDLFSSKASFDTPKLYLYHQPNDLIVPFNYNRIFAGFNTCSVNQGGCAQINDRPFSWGGSGIENMVDTLNIGSNYKPEIRAEFTSNNADCLQQIFDPSTGGHQFDSYWNRTVSLADFFAQDIGINDCESLSISNSAVNRNIVLYPNPIDQFFQIEMNMEEAAVEIYDLKGKVIFSDLSYSNNQQIQIGNFENGVYYVKIASSNGTSIHKLIKANK